MQANCNKQYLSLKNRPILAYTLEVFENHPAIEEIVVVVGLDEFDLCREMVIEPGKLKKVKMTAGGTTRQQSVYAGLCALDASTDMVLIHDGARPFADNALLNRCIQETAEYHATIAAVPAKNTIKQVSKEGIVEATPDRQFLWEVQTPQSFDYKLIVEAHKKARADGVEGTDDAFLVERLGIPVKVVEGRYDNIKITTPEDLAIAESLIEFFAMPSGCI